MKSNKEVGILRWYPRQLEIHDEAGECRDMQKVVRLVDASLEDCFPESWGLLPPSVQEEVHGRGIVAEDVDGDGVLENGLQRRRAGLRGQEAPDNEHQLCLCASQTLGDGCTLGVVIVACRLHVETQDQRLALGDRSRDKGLPCHRVARSAADAVAAIGKHADLDVLRGVYVVLSAYRFLVECGRGRLGAWFRHCDRGAKLA